MNNFDRNQLESIFVVFVTAAKPKKMSSSLFCSTNFILGEHNS